jgi:hypothetical protein
LLLHRGFSRARTSFLKEKPAEQAFCVSDTSNSVVREDKADRVAEGVDSNADHRAQTAARRPDRLIFNSIFGVGCMLVCPRIGNRSEVLQEPRPTYMRA